MSHSDEERAECPLCMEPLEADDLNFYPCTCGYQICRFCWNRIREGENGLCPACRKAYPENPADFTPLSQEQMAAMKTEKRAREQQRRNKSQESRRHLSSVRVVQKNLVFVVGLPIRLADPEILKKPEYFGKYGRIHKVVINHSTSYAGSQGPSASAYVTYVSCADALRAIQNVNNVNIDGRVLKGSLGTTKYCANFMRNQPCPKPDCMYLHELGDPKASFTKEEMHQGLHQAYERQLHNQLLQQTAAVKDPPASQTSTAQSGFISSTVVTSSINIVNPKLKNSNSGNGSLSSSSSSSSASSTGSIGGSKEAWPSLGSLSQDISQQQQSSNNNQNGHLTDTNIQNTGKTKGKHGKENGQSNGEVGNGKVKQGKENKKQNKSNKPVDKQQQNTNTGIINSNRHNGSREESVQIFTDSTDTAGSEQSSNSEIKPNFREQTFGANLDGEEGTIDLESDRHSLLDGHDLLDNSDHSLLEDNDSHDLLNDSLLAKSRMIARGPHYIVPPTETSRMLQRNFDVSACDDSNFLNIASLNNPLGDASKGIILGNDVQKDSYVRPKDILKNIKTDVSTGADRFIPFSNPIADIGTNSFQHSSPYNVRMGQNYGAYPNQSIANSILSSALSNGLIGENGSSLESGLNEERYVGENIMNKFFLDFHKTQQMKNMMNLGNSDIASGPSATPEMQSLAFIESQHLQRKYGVTGDAHLYNGKQQKQDKSGYTKQSTTKEQNGEEGNTRTQSKPSSVDDDLDFDPFKETQKAFAEILETENKQIDTRCSPEINECLTTRRSRHPPPGFTHMNAFGIGVPRPQPATGYTQGNGMIADWTQLDPAIMSTNFPQTKNVLQSQQNLYSRFGQFSISPSSNGGNQSVSKIVHNQPTAGMSRINQLVLSQQTNRVSDESNFHQQNDSLFQQQQQRKLQSLIGQNPSGWMMPSVVNPQLLVQSGQYVNRNGYYNPTTSNGGSDSKFNNMSMPPGFGNVQPPKNTSECIESK